jgi:hypothetical protein
MVHVPRLGLVSMDTRDLDVNLMLADYFWDRVHMCRMLRGKQTIMPSKYGDSDALFARIV